MMNKHFNTQFEPNKKQNNYSLKTSYIKIIRAKNYNLIIVKIYLHFY